MCNAREMKSDFKFTHPSIEVYSNFDIFDIRLLDDKSRQTLFAKKEVTSREVMEVFMKLVSTSSAHSVHSWFKSQGGHSMGKFQLRAQA